MMTLAFNDVSPAAFLLLIDTIKTHGVEFFYSKYDSETVGTFSSVAGTGTFVHDGQRLTVTILTDGGHFSRLMIKGGLRQLVSEVLELHS